jgi:hypothetical protein
MTYDDVDIRRVMANLVVLREARRMNSVDDPNWIYRVVGYERAMRKIETMVSETERSNIQYGDFMEHKVAGPSIMAVIEYVVRKDVNHPSVDVFLQTNDSTLSSYYGAYFDTYMQRTNNKMDGDLENIKEKTVIHLRFVRRMTLKVVYSVVVVINSVLHAVLGRFWVSP